MVRLGHREADRRGLHIRRRVLLRRDRVKALNLSACEFGRLVIEYSQLSVKMLVLVIRPTV